MKPIIDEIATAKKDIDLFAGWIGRLENPDPVLSTEAGGKGLKLYDEVARDPHAGSVLQTRYLAVVGKEWEVLPPEDASDKDKTIADFVMKCFSRINFDQARQEIMQAILYGYYPAEVMWTVMSGKIVPSRIMAKHPRRFIFGLERDPKLLTPESMVDGESIPDRKFIIFTYGSSDNPYGCGLGQKLWWPIWFKKHGIKFWMVFLEKFGMPTTVGKYPAGTPTDQQTALLDAIDAIHNETGIKIPDSMKIELLEATRSGNVSYETMCDYMDRQISKAVLGQTLTTEVKGEGSYAASQTHNDVRGDILKADADILCECLNNTLVKWIVDYNFSDVSEYPKLWIRTEEESSLKELADRDKILVKDIGLPISKRYFYETYAIPEPEEDEPLIEEESKIFEYHMKYGTPTVNEVRRRLRLDDFPGGNVPVIDKTVSENSQSAGFAEKKTLNSAEAQVVVDDLADEYAAAAARKVLDGWKDTIRGYLDGANSMQEAVNNIDGLYDAVAGDALSGMLADALLTSDKIGIDSTGGPDFVEAQWGPGKPFGEAVDYFKAKALTLSNVARADVLGTVKSELLDAMESGKSINDFRKSINDVFEKNGWDKLHPRRVETIFRTNMQNAYQAARYRQMTSAAVLAARPYWRYVAVMDGSTRPDHAAVDGKIFRHDHPFWTRWYPPNGFNCRCTVQTLSAREIERNGWTVDTEDPTGTLVEPTDPVTGNKMPARLLMPDNGFGGRPNTLEAILDSKSDAGELGRIAWKERPGQPGPDQFGRPTEKNIPDSSYRPAIGKLKKVETLVAEGQSRSSVLVALENEYKKIMGISPKETFGVLKGPDGEILSVSIDSLAHAMLNRQNSRERYIRYFRDVIENPFEVLLTEYETTSGMTKYRKKYIGLYQEGKKDAVIITAEVSPEGWAMWNVMNARKGTVDRHRHGVKVLFGQ